MQTQIANDLSTKNLLDMIFTQKTRPAQKQWWTKNYSQRNSKIETKKRKGIAIRYSSHYGSAQKYAFN